MSVATRTITVALVGNPNTGKSTLFNALSGLRQRVGNYPGCTVEEKVGTTEHNGQTLTLVDLPGTYSLAPRSPDEMIAVEVLLGRRGETPPPDVVLCIVDASNLERNLYLLSQVREAERPIVVALNMIDVARDQGVAIDTALLEKRLGAPVVEVQANTGYGVEELKQALVKAGGMKALPPPRLYAESFEREIETLAAHLNDRSPTPWPRYLVERVLLDTSGYFQAAGLPGIDESLAPKLAAARERLAVIGMPVPAVEAMARYTWVAEVLAGVVERPATRTVTWSDRVDQILTHRWWGTMIFAVVMLVVFQSIFSWAAPLSDLIDGGIQSLAGLVGSWLPEGAVQSLLVKGVIGGVGGVLVFLPQICILFGFIALLEDCGYMARAAYLMDRLMAGVGLSGKSFIPLLSSFACAIPGIMATRVIDNPRDRLVTMLIAPLMSCSARLPVYTLLIAAFIPNDVVAFHIAGHEFRLELFYGISITWPAVTMFAMYLVGIVTAILVAWVLKSTLLAGDTPPFVMELPPYKTPSATNVALRMGERAWSFLYRAGTLILAVSVIVWAMSYFPRDEQAVEGPHVAKIAELKSVVARENAVVEEQRTEPQKASLAAAEEELADLENHIASTYLEQSLLGRLGHFIEPAVRPLGWDWRIGCAAIASFPAREVVVGTLGVIYNVGEADEESGSLKNSLRDARWPDGRPVFTIPVALSLMVFFALCAQCAATLAVMVRETNGYTWPAFTFLYMTSLAYVAALVTYQVGTWIAGG